MAFYPTITEDRYDAAAQDMPSAALPAATLKLDRSVGELSELISMSEDKLSLLLRPEEPTPELAEKLAVAEKMSAAAGRSTSSHTKEIQDIARRVEQARQRLAQILGRLDV